MKTLQPAVKNHEDNHENNAAPQNELICITRPEHQSSMRAKFALLGTNRMFA